MVDKESVIQALRATLISVQGALTLKQCNSDYRELQGEWIPYKKLGYASLDKLFLDVPGFKVTQANGEFYVDAVAKQESQHIAAMVARQKPKKKPIKSSYQKRYPEKNNWRKPTSSSYASNYNSDYSNKFYRSNGTPQRYNNNNSYNKVPYKYPNNRYQDSRQVVPPAPKLFHKAAPSDNYRPDPPRPDPPKPELSRPEPPSKPSVTRTVSADNKQPVFNETKPKPVIEQPQPEPRRSKLTASQRLLNLRESLTIDSIPLITPALNDKVRQYDPENYRKIPSPEPLVPSSPPPPPTASAVARLEWTCRKLLLPDPEYKVSSHHPFYCTVKAGKTYSALSYPDASPSEEQAREVAAEKLLISIEGSQSALPTTSGTAARTNLLKLVAEAKNGLVSTTIPHLYREKYSENLPSNWQTFVEDCPDIQQENTGFGMFLLRARDTFNIAHSPVSETALLEESVDVDIPPLQFPDDNFWNVLVMVCNSSVEIWLRILGDEYSIALDTLLDDMTNYYSYLGLSVDESIVVTHAWYAVFIEDDGWQRGKVLEVDGENVTVFLGDRGDEETVHYSKLRILEPQFKKLPLQAIWCRLEGLEELATSAAGCEAVQRLITCGPLVAEVGPRVDPADPDLAIVLYDTSTDLDVNLNNDIRDAFCNAAVFGVAQLQQLCDVDVRCVTEEGLVWAARRGGGACVGAALSLLTAPGPYRRPLPASPPTPASDPRTLYIVRTISGDWVRCTIITGLDGEGTVRTLLVDSGLIMRAPASSLVPLQSFSDVLTRYPHQAIQVRLGGSERIFKSMSGRLRELLLGQCVICRSAGNSAAGVPLVELYVRTAENILASVRSSLLTEYEYTQRREDVKEADQRTTDQVEALHRKKERIFTRSASANLPAGAGADTLIRAYSSMCSSLPAPQLPAPGKCFDVFVAMAANPWNFVIQPNSTRSCLQSMMQSLQECCPALPSGPPPAVGALATALYPQDDTWYRVVIVDTVSADMISVYFCDYGDMAPMPATALRPLPPSAPLAATLPPQAIRAKLHGVQPIDQDWTVEDCIRFHELVVEKQLVGVCHGVSQDPIRRGEVLLSLDLVDTATEDDVYLARLLVDEGRAKVHP